MFGLNRELELRGNAVEIIPPEYDCARYERIYGLTVAYEHLWVPWFTAAVHCTVWFGWVDGRKCFYIEPHSEDRLFERALCMAVKMMLLGPRSSAERRWSSC